MQENVLREKDTKVNGHTVQCFESKGFTCTVLAKTEPCFVVDTGTYLAAVGRWRVGAIPVSGRISYSTLHRTRAFWPLFPRTPTAVHWSIHNYLFVRLCISVEFIAGLHIYLLINIIIIITIVITTTTTITIIIVTTTTTPCTPPSPPQPQSS